jgi:hypothetical protein
MVAILNLSAILNQYFSEKSEKSEQKISFANILLKNLPVVVVKPENSDQNSLKTGNQIKSLFGPVRGE